MTSAEIPVGLRVHLAHAAIQGWATRASADVLHVKGPAVDPRLRPLALRVDPATGEVDDAPAPRLSTDVDILVRPAHVAALLEVLADAGWRTVTTFASGSAFEHAATLWRDDLGYVDVHRRFPGIGMHAGEAFDLLWETRETAAIAHWPCGVPSVVAQRLLLILHGARGGGLSNPDVDLLWTQAADADRAAVAALADRLGAQVALAAATGRLDDYRHDPDYPLWRHFVNGGSRLDEWLARLRAARTPRAKLRLLARSVLVNTDHLAMELNRTPTRADLARAYADRVAQVGTELGRRVRGLGGRR